MPYPITEGGVYLITCLPTERVYVGSAIDDFGTRWLHHRYQLRLSKHHNRPLQEDWNRWGEDTFIFSVLERIPIDRWEAFSWHQIVHDREAQWLVEYQQSRPCYNRLRRFQTCRICGAYQVPVDEYLFHVQGCAEIEKRRPGRKRRGGDLRPSLPNIRREKWDVQEKRKKARGEAP